MTCLTAHIPPAGSTVLLKAQSPRALTLTCHKHRSTMAAVLEDSPSVLETLQLSSAPLRLDFWLRFCFWPWIRKSFFLRSFCRLSFSSSSFCFIFTCSLLCRCLCSLAFFIFWLCIVLRASSRARTWQDKKWWAQASRSLPVTYVVRTSLHWLLLSNEIQSQVEINWVKIHHNLHGDVGMYAVYPYDKDPHLSLYGTKYN